METQYIVLCLLVCSPLRRGPVSVQWNCRGSHIMLICLRLVSLSPKGAFEVTSHSRVLRTLEWDLPIVLLDALCRPPIVLLAQAEFKWVSDRTAFLLTITPAGRVGELHDLPVSDWRELSHSDQPRHSPWRCCHNRTSTSL